MSLQASCSSVPSSHFALLQDDQFSVNAICRLSIWENVQFAVNEPLPLWVRNPNAQAELLSVAVASSCRQVLTEYEKERLQELNEFHDIFSESSADLGLVSPRV